MKRCITLLLSLLAFAAGAQAAVTPWETNPHGRVRMIIPYASLPSSGTVVLGIEFQPIEGWHVYHRNPGDSGFPPKLDFTGSSGFKNSELLFPAPKRYELPGDLIAIGYDTQVVYPIRVERTPGDFHLKVLVSYLTCEESCIPYKYRFSLEGRQNLGAVLDPELASLVQAFLLQVPKEERGELTLGVEPHAGSPVAPASSRSRAGFLLLGFLGGLLLNVMPCVLPVLSIKLLGLLQHGGQSRSIVIRDSLASAAGIIVSFLALAGAAIAARSAGKAVGWGIQFQEPVFVALLTLILLLFALNLWGLFEILLPPWLARWGTQSTEDEGPGSFFVSGLFVTVLATPCSAPFLGTALGFALAQPAMSILAIFTAVGAGLAFPYFLLALVPQALQHLPRPGAWMIRLRMVLGFLLMATVIWLGAVLSRQVSAHGMLIFTLLCLALSFVIWWRGGQSSGKARLITLLAAVGISFFALYTVSQNRHAGSVADPHLQSQLRWIPFDEKDLQRRVAAGEKVFVDVTADWCFTCKVNEKLVLASDAVQKAFEEQKITLLQADWTNHDPAIGNYLKTMGRVGIPFYAYYRPGKEPIVLSEFLTTKQILEALRQ